MTSGTQTDDKLSPKETPSSINSNEDGGSSSNSIIDWLLKKLRSLNCTCCPRSTRRNKKSKKKRRANKKKEQNKKQPSVEEQVVRNAYQEEHGSLSKDPPRSLEEDPVNIRNHNGMYPQGTTFYGNIENLTINTGNVAYFTQPANPASDPPRDQPQDDQRSSLSSDSSATNESTLLVAGDVYAVNRESVCPDSNITPSTNENNERTWSSENHQKHNSLLLSRSFMELCDPCKEGCEKIEMQDLHWAKYHRSQLFGYSW